MNYPEIKIGARGWRHLAWQGEFYPDDMPHEWWLTYYSNEFNCVLVPWDYLQDIQPEDLQIWVDDTYEAFTFYLELAVSASSEHVDQILSVLGPRLGGAVIRQLTGASLNTSRNTSRNNSTEDADAKAWLKNVTHYGPVAVDWQSLSPSNPLYNQQSHLGCYWPAEQERYECPGELGILETGGGSHDPKALKNLLQHCRSAQGPITIGLFFAGAVPRIEEIRNAIMILQMLG